MLVPSIKCTVTPIKLRICIVSVQISVVRVTFWTCANLSRNWADNALYFSSIRLLIVSRLGIL